MYADGGVEKRHLFTPGPTPVPPPVLAALAEPVLHHRGPDFRLVYSRCLERLKAVCRTEREVLLFTSSGSGLMESAVANLVSPGDRVLVVSAGYFGERWTELARAYGADVEELAYAWGEAPSAADLAARLDGHGVVFLTHSETSTGVVADLQPLAAAAKDAGALVAVDAVSSLGAVPLETDAWGLDVVVSGSQKALMTPPGLALVTVSEYAWARRGAAPRFYFDWERTRAAQEKLDAVFTPATSLVVALDVALGLLLEEGLETAFPRVRSRWYSSPSPRASSVIWALLLSACSRLMPYLPARCSAEERSRSGGAYGSSSKLRQRSSTSSRWSNCSSAFSIRRLPT